jgi:tight adherence protein C
VIERVVTDRYPRLTVRFSFTPIDGPPPAYLEPRDVAISDGGRPVEPDEVYPVERVPTSRTGTYEAVWQSRAAAQPGQTVQALLALSLHGRPEVAVPMVYVRPMPHLASGDTEPRPALPLNAVPAPDPNAMDQRASTALAAILAGTALLCVVAAIVWRAVLRRAQERLSIWVAGSAPDRAKLAARAASGRRIVTISPLVQFFGRIGARFVPSGQASKLRRNLVLAGRPTAQHYTRFVATKAGLGVVLFGLGAALMAGRAPLITGLTVALSLGTLGFMLPTIWLGRAITKRKYAIRKALPDALDLMTIGVSAGLAFDGAIAEIVEKWDNELSREFSVMLGELRMGTGRREALLNLADRTQVDEIQIMTSQLIQADELGMSLSETLMIQADQMRMRRRQRAEELAHKATVKMMIPMVLLIFPALFIVIIGPAVPSMMSFLQNGAGG